MKSGRQAVTIKHVAAEAGVSLQTVSRVINNEPNVRPVVQERVLAAVAKLGYVPSLAARRMGGSRSYLLLAINDRDRTIEGWRSGEGTDWVDQMLLGGMLKTSEFGYRMIFELVDTHSSHVEREVQAALSALHPDGVILTPPHSDNPQITELLAKQGLPFARIGSATAGNGFAICMDDGEAAEVATDHLLDLGHVRVGFITGSDDYALSGARLEGYRKALARRGLPHDDALVGRGDFSFASGEAATEAFCDLADPPTALVASNDQMALAALRVAGRRGLNVPRDLSIVSFDDTPIVRFSNPSLTAIVQPIAAMTAEAAHLLIRSKSGTTDLPQSTILPFGIAVREFDRPSGRLMAGNEAPSAMIRRRSLPYLLLYALAYGGGVIAYVPLLTLLLPLKVEEMVLTDKVALLSLATLMGAVAASIANIVAGMLSDRTPARLGGRRIWVVIGLIATLASFAGLALAGTPATLVLAVIVFQTALNFMLAPLVAIGADEVPDDQKGLMGGLLGAAFPLGSIAAIVVTTSPDLGEGAQFVIVGLLVVMGMAVFLSAMRPGDIAPVARRPTVAKAIGRRNLILVWVARLLMQVAGIVLFAFFLFYFQSVEHDGVWSNSRKLAGRIAWLSGLVTVLTVPLAIILGRISDRVGQRKPFLAGTAAVAVMGLLTMAVFPKWAPAATGYVMFSCASGVFLALQSAYAMQLLPAPDHRGRDLGIINLANTAPAILAPSLTFAMVGVGGFRPLMLVLAILTAIAGAMMFLVRDRARA